MEKQQLLNYDAQAILKFGGAAVIGTLAQTHLEGLERVGVSIIAVGACLGGVASAIEAINERRRQKQIEDIG